MRRARPLVLAMNALRRQEEELERRLGIIPDRIRGISPRFRNEGERVLGGRMLVFLWEGVCDSQCSTNQYQETTPYPAPLLDFGI